MESGGIGACLPACDAFAGCIAFTFSEIDATEGNGFCYLRTSGGTTSSDDTFALGIMVGSEGSFTAATTTSTTSTAGTAASTTTSGYSGATSEPGNLPVPPSDRTLCDFGDPVGTSEDDSYCEIDLPFEMQIYTQRDTKTFASTNGVSKPFLYLFSPVSSPCK